jgi:hypothetical protein
VIPASDPHDGAAIPRRRPFSRTAWHALGLLLAGLLAWLALRGYQDPALMLELANWRLC